ncbi:hypothetical protein AKO1_001332 [Acrasis kona]|uniref:Uncharacterized protein n=1 Tax=Acrasis kona TaxID=1008807 RepID=A0AAW2ZGG1_9EUKA
MFNTSTATRTIPVGNKTRLHLPVEKTFFEVDEQQYKNIFGEFATSAAVNTDKAMEYETRLAFPLTVYLQQSKKVQGKPTTTKLCFHEVPVTALDTATGRPVPTSDGGTMARCVRATKTLGINHVKQVPNPNNIVLPKIHFPVMESNPERERIYMERLRESLKRLEKKK